MIYRSLQFRYCHRQSKLLQCKAAEASTSLFVRRYVITTGFTLNNNNNTNLFLKMSTFIWRHGIRLRDDRYNVNFVVKTLHKLHVQRFQTVTRGCDEVQATMYSAVWDLPSHNATLGVQELLVF